MKERIQLGLIVTLVVFAALLVVDIAMADTVILPLIFNGSAQTANPTHVLYVFSSTAAVSGNAGGRAGLNNICTSSDTSSHACTLHEIENAMRTSGVYFKEPFISSWVDNPPTFGTELNVTSASNWEGLSCDGWKSTLNNGTLISPLASSIVWGSSHNSIIDNACNVSNAVACCKWIP